MGYMKTYEPPPRDNPDAPKRPSEPPVPANAEHLSLVASGLVLIGVVAVILVGGWALSSTEFETSAAKHMQQSAAPAAMPSQTTTGAAVR